MKVKSLGMDEMYTEFFECPFCKSHYLTKCGAFCPECGKRVFKKKELAE